MSTIPPGYDPPLQPRHWVRGGLALLIAFGAALAVPASAQRIWLKAPVELPESAIPDAGGLVSIAPGSVEAIAGSEGVIFAGSSPAPMPVASPTVTGPSGIAIERGTVDESAPTEQLRLTPPDIRRAWLSTQLPASVPRLEYSGWAYIKSDDQGNVTESRITTSSGNPEVDAATMTRLERERLSPAVETLDAGTRVPMPYAGPWFFRWVML